MCTATDEEKKRNVNTLFFYVFRLILVQIMIKDNHISYNYKNWVSDRFQVLRVQIETFDSSTSCHLKSQLLNMNPSG